MELRHLRSFMVLCEHLHFGQAAESLHIVQPALTKQIKELEAHLGVSLFQRSKRKVSITHEGEYFRSQCASILESLANAEKEIRWIADGNKGEVKLGYVGSCIHTFLPGLLAKLSESHPGIHCYLNEMTSVAQEQALIHNELDVGFLRNPEKNPMYHQQIVFTEPFAVVIPAGHPITQANFEGMAQFSLEKFILPTRSDGKLYYELQLSICEDAGFSPHIAHESVHGHTVLRMVEHGLGITLLPLSFLQFSNDKIRFIPLTNIAQKSEITMLWKKENRNPALQRLVEVVAGS